MMTWIVNSKAKKRLMPYLRQCGEYLSTLHVKKEKNLHRGMQLEMSVEVTHLSEKLKSIPALRRYKGRVYIPYVQNDDAKRITTVAEDLLSLDCSPVPHVPVRRFSSWKELENVLGVWENMGIREIFLIGGDVPKPLGPLDNSMQVLESGILQEIGLKRVGCALHPEGNVNDPHHMESLLEKIKWMKDQKSTSETRKEKALDMCLVSQPCFSSAIINQCLHSARSHTPMQIWIGTVGPSDAASLVRFARICGISTSLRMIQTHCSQLSNLATALAPEHIINSVESSHFHIFSLGGLEVTLQWMEILKESWEDSPRVASS
mmetsp:Transcript_14815/g.20627  ORF Transcript_14815/g.20627 Transcript_14815/m.20627 type:complete len:319 (-) Transcript_14815:232-1188(-)